MNKKIVMLIGALFCGSFSVVVGAEEPILLFKEGVDFWGSTIEVPVALTAEGKKIYNDLMAKYKNKTLTLADRTKRNLDILSFQQKTLWKNYEDNKYILWDKKSMGRYINNVKSRNIEEKLFNVIVPVLGVGGAIVSDYAGRATNALLQYGINKNVVNGDAMTLQSVGDSLGKTMSIVPKIFLVGTAALLAGGNARFIDAYMHNATLPLYNMTVGIQNKIIGIHNSIVDSYNQWRFNKKEIVLIGEVIDAIMRLKE